MCSGVPTTSSRPGRREETRGSRACPQPCFFPCNVLNFDSDKTWFLWLLSVCLKHDRFWCSAPGAGSCGSR